MTPRIHGRLGGLALGVCLLLALTACRPTAPPPEPTATAVAGNANPLFLDQLTATATRVPTRTPASPVVASPGSSGGGAPAVLLSVTPSPAATREPARQRPATPTFVPPPAGPRGYSAADLLVNPAWVERNRGNPRLRIVDARPPEQYAAGHLPGAISLGPEWLVDLGGRVPSTLLSPAGFSAEMTADGIGNDTEVVVYDDDGGLWAARVIWALNAYGHTKTYLLEGGTRAWRAAGLPVSSQPDKAPRADFEAQPAPAVQASAAEVRAALDDPKTIIVDARSPEEYRAKLRLAARAGHIPGAVSHYWREDLRPDGQYFKPAEELTAAYHALGVTPEKQVIVYDQTGVQAAHVYFALKLLGYPNVRVYDGSWLEWGNNADLPIVTEDSPR